MNSPFKLRNIRCFILLRLFFNARFYYPVFTVLFLDYGLTVEQFATLNAIWALTIVLAEVPSGALADVLGRRALLLFTAGSMVVEMAFIAFVPLGFGNLVYLAFLANRILSGLAEAMASGADEALAYDSLKQHGLEKQWSHVLDIQMRVQSAGYVIAMTLGAAVFDSALLNRIVAAIGWNLQLNQQITMRFPVYLTLLLALLALVTTLLMQEEKKPRNKDGFWPTLQDASNHIWQAGRWVASTPQVLCVILFGMFFDHIMRMLVTLTSQYYRIVGLPEASFGLIGSMIALIGMVVPRGARYMAENLRPIHNVVILACLSFGALLGLLLLDKWLGIFFVTLVFIVMMCNSFFMSHYINHATASKWRATVLSFKGLFFNLAYGAIGFGYAALYNQAKRGANGNEDLVFAQSLYWFPQYFVVGILLLFAFAAWRMRKAQDNWWKIGQGAEGE